MAVVREGEAMVCNLRVVVLMPRGDAKRDDFAAFDEVCTEVVALAGAAAQEAVESAVKDSFPTARVVVR